MKRGLCRLVVIFDRPERPSTGSAELVKGVIAANNVDARVLYAGNPEVRRVLTKARKAGKLRTAATDNRPFVLLEDEEGNIVSTKGRPGQRWLDNALEDGLVRNAQQDGGTTFASAGGESENGTAPSERSLEDSQGEGLASEEKRDPTQFSSGHREDIARDDGDASDTINKRVEASSEDDGGDTRELVGVSAGDSSDSVRDEDLDTSGSGFRPSAEGGRDGS